MHFVSSLYVCSQLGSCPTSANTSLATSWFLGLFSTILLQLLEQFWWATFRGKQVFQNNFYWFFPPNMISREDLLPLNSRRWRLADHNYHQHYQSLTTGGCPTVFQTWYFHLVANFRIWRIVDNSHSTTEYIITSCSRGRHNHRVYHRCQIPDIVRSPFLPIYRSDCLFLWIKI